MSDKPVRVLIVGGGPAGYTAAIYAARAGLAPVCIEGYDYGGQISRSPRVDNFPGYPDGVSGNDLGERMRAQALRLGAQIVTSEVQAVLPSGSPFTVVTDGTRYLADALIVSTGARSRRLGLASEDALDGMGVCYCAICDGAFFADRRVAVIGGGDAAVEEALMLCKVASSVLLVHRRHEFRATQAMRAALEANPRARILTPYVVAEVLGEPPAGVTGIRLRHAETGAERQEDLDGVFVAIGHVPASEMFTPWLPTDEHGFLLTEARTQATSVPGVFAAGDIADPRYRQAITAAASGCQAAIDAERWLVRGGRSAQTLSTTPTLETTCS